MWIWNSPKSPCAKGLSTGWRYRKVVELLRGGDQWGVLGNLGASLWRGLWDPGPFLSLFAPWLMT